MAPGPIEPQLCSASLSRVKDAFAAMIFKVPRASIVLLMIFTLSSCVLEPKDTALEKATLEKAGAPYQSPPEKLQSEDLPSPATWQVVLQRAFLCNGELEAAQYEWRAVMAQIPQVATW